MPEDITLQSDLNGLCTPPEVLRPLFQKAYSPRLERADQTFVSHVNQHPY